MNGRWRSTDDTAIDISSIRRMQTRKPRMCGTIVIEISSLNHGSEYDDLSMCRYFYIFLIINQ